MAIEEEVEGITQEVEADTTVEVIGLSGIEGILEVPDEAARVPGVQKDVRSLLKDLEADHVDPTNLLDLQDPLHPGLHLHIANLQSLPEDVGLQKNSRRKRRQLLCRTAH